MSSGNEGCSCINQTSILASLLDNRDCTTANSLPGIYLTLGGSCVAYDYGSSVCLQHDLVHDPICQVTYTTCNSTDYFWQQQSSANNVTVAGGVNISVAVPGLYVYPMINKQLPDGTILWTTTEDKRYYFDDTIPYGGIYIDYVNSLVNVSNGDIQNMTFTHTSRASMKRYPTSSFTAAVRDVENGLVDMAVGPFWITGQRLRLTTFTVPLVYDKTVLVIPKPGTKSSLAYQTQKVLFPFTYPLWGVVLAVIVVASLLSVWFTDREMAAKKRYGLKLRQQGKPWKRRKLAYFRLILDAFLEKGMFFFSAGIEQDTGAISAYVAELAAMLTQSGLEKGVGTMELVVEKNIPICGHPALEEEIRMKWPKANWLFPSESGTYDSMLEAYARGDCKVLAISREDSIMNFNFMNKVCELDLVYTDVLVTENPIAFPINPQLASAFSYWMYTAEKTYGIDLNSAKQAFIEKNDIKAQCEVELSKLSNEAEEELPRLYDDNKRKKGRSSSKSTFGIGRKSTLATAKIKSALGIFANKRYAQNTKLDYICCPYTATSTHLTTPPAIS
eukprot:scaffold298_cov130-Skeletonema_menzelii.AAC.4